MGRRSTALVWPMRDLLVVSPAVCMGVPTTGARCGVDARIAPPFMEATDCESTGVCRRGFVSRILTHTPCALLSFSFQNLAHPLSSSHPSYVSIFFILGGRARCRAKEEFCALLHLAREKHLRTGRAPLALNQRYTAKLLRAKRDDMVMDDSNG